MSLPNSTLSVTPSYSEWVYPFPEEFDNFVDFEVGSSAIGSTVGGTDTHMWKIRYDGANIKLGRYDTTTETTLLTVPDLVKIALAFDQNMNPCYAWQNGASGYTNLIFYDTSINAYSTITITGATSPCLTLDDRREQFSGSSDVIFAYIRNGNLYYRQQRDRFLTERLLKSGVTTELIRIGMNTKYRLQFQFRYYEPI